ncbi:MAG: UvrD-helicase domain-containing protein, partial [Deltaproteobacteria bacterium]|nr:UvrD-helicase domain-containing protein [Deltaproteobacteria bacterium]
MKFIADLHIHSKYSRATSRSLTPESLSLWGQKKGIKVIGTGDFTHPEWFSELKEKLHESENGLFSLKPEYEKGFAGDIPSGCASKTLFILSGEISCIYKKNDKTRKVHNLILMPDFESAEKFNTALDKIGNIKSDGRPILGLDSKILLEMMLEASDRGFFIPAHVWTPWFSLFGSKSGFDEIEECFEDLTPYIHALETGLSSDPPMNRLLSALDRYTLVSNSDAHSPSKLGREANIFKCNPDYDSMISAMKEKTGFEGTIEFFPEEGKYHMDGHRKCDIMLHPRDTIKNKGICPVCGKPVTVGVFHRVAELADRETPVLQKEFYSLIPLAEILSEILGAGPNTKTVETAYEKLLSDMGPELNLLLDAELSDIETAGGILLSRAISRMRSGEVIKQEGYDGEYGVIKLFRDSEKHDLIGQKKMFNVPETKMARKPRPDIKNAVKPKKKALKTSEQVSFVDPILDPLNEKQREAVLHTESHLIINAGPGTGKTLTLTHKIAREIHNGIAPDQILALTFTNKAAREMKERVNALLPGVIEKGIMISTFHGFCLNILRDEGSNIDISPDFSICSEGDSLLIAEEAAKKTGADRQTISRFKKVISDLRLMQATGREPGEELDDI